MSDIIIKSANSIQAIKHHLSQCKTVENLTKLLLSIHINLFKRRNTILKVFSILL